MTTPEITLELLNSPTDLQTQLINDYWKSKNSKYLSKSSDLVKKYKLSSISQVAKIVKNHSQLIVFDTICYECKKPIYITVKVRSEFPTRRGYQYTTCETCKNERYKKTKIAELREKELCDTRQSLIDHIDKEIHTEQDKFDYAIEKSVVQLLKPDEESILKMILQTINTKLIFKYLRKHFTEWGRPVFWEKLDLLESLGLIARRGNKKAPTKFIFDDRIYDVLEINRPSSSEIIKDHKKLFSLRVNLDLNVDSISRTSLYEGSIIVNEEINLTKGTIVNFLAPCEEDNKGLRLVITEIDKLKK